MENILWLLHIPHKYLRKCQQTNVMVLNSGKGGKGCRKMKNSTPIGVNRKLEFKELGQEYGLVLDMLGNGRCRCLCTDNITRLCMIRGNMRKGSFNRIYKGDLVLVSLREFQDSKADIIHLYKSEEVRALQEYNELSSDFMKGDVVQTQDDNDMVEFSEIETI